MERLDLRLVEYFIAVAEELHFSRAAERLHIAQPSLSQQIRRLEAQLGVTLLERDSRNVELTPAGETLLRDGREALSQAQRAIRATRATANSHLTVGFYGSAANALLPETLREFRHHHPSSDVVVRELLLGSIDDILDGGVDLAFTRLRPEQTELEVEVLAHEPRVVALGIEHPLMARETLLLADLRDESFIVNPAVPTNGAPPRWLDEQRRHGLPGRIAAEAASIQEILTLVASGRAACLMPSVIAQQYPRADVGYVPVRDAEPAIVSIAWRPGPLPSLARHFIDIAHHVAAREKKPLSGASEVAGLAQVKWQGSPALDAAP